MEALAQYGYAGLFLAAFLAATILPLSSEAVLIFLLVKGLDPVWLVAVATLGNVLGAFTNYAIGFWGGPALAGKFLRTSRPEYEKAEQRLRKYGAAALFFAWLPIIGDPITIVAGALKVNLWVFSSLVFAGKFLRYLALACWTL